MRSADRKGITLIELLVVIAIISILASAVMPLSRMTVRRIKEIELRSGLRTVRSAIDAFNRDCLTKKLASDNCSHDNYPESLEALTKPLTLAGTGDKTRKYLRRIPRDPMMPPDYIGDENGWGLRSYSDLPDSTQWGGENVYDVYSKSEETGLEGVKDGAWERMITEITMEGDSMRQNDGGRGFRSQRGFTLLELMIVLAIMGILITIAQPNLKTSITRAKEAVLREDLFQVREALDQFYADNGKYPSQLAELVNQSEKSRSYLREIPKDPFTGAPDWITIGIEGDDGGAFDVHSASPLVATNGMPYNTW